MVSQGDLNGDGWLDIVTADYTSSGVSVLLGNGNGTFTSSVSFHTAGTGPHSVTLGDLNGDGRLDLATADRTGPDVSVFLANGNYSSSTPYLNINNQQFTRDTMTILDGNLQRVESQIGVLGATTSRFGTALAALQSQSLGYTTAASRITDVDVAEESAKLSSTQILQQASASILAQANQQPSLALQLLRE